MRWLFIALACVAAQPSTPLLPSGVTIDQVKRIEVEATGTVEFLQTSESSPTITNRLSFSPTITFDSKTGVLTVNALAANGSSMLRPGLFAAFLAVALCAFNSNSKHTPILLCLLLGLGVAQAGLVVADLTIRVPGCWHTENNGLHLIFDQECVNATVKTFAAPANPVGYGPPTEEWAPINPQTAYLPMTDNGKHYLDPSTQYEVWRANYGRRFNATEKEHFLHFTEMCRVQNMDPNRSWTAACNQFAILSDDDWKAKVLADNEYVLGNFSEEHSRRRLLEADLFSDVEDTRRKLLQAPASFSWVGTGKLTPVKDQGQCGSCYAHSTASQMEAALAIAKGTVPVPLSREQLKSCSQGSPGCNGGVPAYMYNYAKGAQGLGTEAARPYVAQNTACGTAPATAYANTGYVSVANNELAFKLAVQSAPVAVTVCAGTWSSYGGGVFTNCAANCGVDHAVLLVGYGTDATLGPYWLIQNSWNTWWGESGFIRLPRTDSGTAGVGACGLTKYTAQQASGVSGPGGGTSGGTACQGYWSAYSACTKTCGGGVQTRTWTTTSPATGTGAACPNPTTQSQSCNTALCPGGGGSTSTCLRVGNSVLGQSGDGDYKSITGWVQNFCGTAPIPQYENSAKNLMLFFYVTNCVNGVRTAGLWGLGPPGIPRAAYQWSAKVTITNGVIPPPTTATGWTIQLSQGTTCV